MFRFLKNLFNLGKKKQKEHTYIDDDYEVTVDESKGQMIIRTTKNLTNAEIIELFKKYLLRDYK